MLSKNTVVSYLLLNKFPNLVFQHCSNDCLELAVNDVTKISQKDLLSKLNESIDSRIFSTRAAHKSLGEQEIDPNREKYKNLMSYFFFFFLIFSSVKNYLMTKAIKKY